MQWSGHFGGVASKLRSRQSAPRYEAVARSLRDVLALRWLRTKKTQYKLDPKRAYYLSMEFLIGRSLASNVSNLLLDPAMLEACREKNVDWYELLDQEPDAGLGNGGLGRLAACFVESMATMELPAMGYVLRYEYGIFKQDICGGWQNEKPDSWLRRPDPWEGRTYPGLLCEIHSVLIFS